MADFEWYRSFVAVYQQGTVSAAAQLRSLTQPAVSGHIAALELTCGSALFQRMPRQMVPTAEGQALYARIVSAVEQLEGATYTPLTKSTTPLHIRLGAPREYFFVSGLKQLASSSAIAYQLSLTIGQTASLIRLLETNELDAVIATQRPNRRDVQFVPLITERFILIGSTQLEVPESQSLEDKQVWLEAQSWLTYAPDLPIIRRFWQEVFGHRPQFNPKLVLPDLLLILRGVELGLGLSVLPDYLCAEALTAGRVQMLIQHEQTTSNNLYLAFRREYARMPEIIWVQNMLQNT